MAKRVVVPVHYSDGDPLHRPTNEDEYEQDPSPYLEKLAFSWRKHRGDSIVPGVTYTLDKLPDGYVLFGRRRKSSPSHIDKWLYGHPRHKKFDSPNRFFPHFLHMMENNGDSIGCICTVCASSSKSALPMGATPSTKHVAALGRPTKQAPGTNTAKVDEEGTPDVYRNLIDSLERHGDVDEEIKEPLSLEWLAERASIEGDHKQWLDGAQYLPRVGEIVLFVRDIPEDATISRERRTGEFKIYNETAAPLGYPCWEAGVVGQVPREATGIDDLAEEPPKRSYIGDSGVRVEPLPDINSTDKSISKRSIYIPLHYTRPFIFYKDFLHNIPEDNWHPTIKNALKVMSTFSLVHKYRFRGTWPEAQIFCKAIFVGSELLTIGDTVRLLPKSTSSNQSVCTDILIIASIRLKLTNLDQASSNDYDGGRPYNSSVLLYGKGYTIEQRRSDKAWLDDSNNTPNNAGYDARFPLHPSSKEMVVPIGRIFGRLYGVDAMTLWLPCQTSADGQVSPRDLDQGRLGLLEARRYAQEQDGRINSDMGATWFWGDSRAQALDLETINGLEVSAHDDGRDVKDHRKKIKEVEKEDVEEQTVQRLAMRKGRDPPRGTGRLDLSGLVAPPQPRGPPPLPTRGTGSKEASGSGSSSAGHGSSGPLRAENGLKRGKEVINLDDYDDDVQFVRQNTRILTNEEAGARSKRVKVAVVIRK